jgi:hypothetical protein
MARSVDWKGVAEATLHPLQVEILEAAATRERVSPVELSNKHATAARVSYHFHALSRVGLLELVETTPRRGATQHFYRLATRLRR